MVVARHRRVLLEVPVASLDDALTAHECGADRLELNTAFPLGGLTPSAGLIAAVAETVKLPLIVMVRPRPGGFCYSDSEFDVMLRDAVRARTGCNQVHASLRSYLVDPSTAARPQVRFGSASGSEDRYDATSAEMVRGLRSALDDLLRPLTSDQRE
jgi:copper homeostasis protein CutC